MAVFPLFLEPLVVQVLVDQIKPILRVRYSWQLCKDVLTKCQGGRGYRIHGEGGMDHIGGEYW